MDVGEDPVEVDGTPPLDVQQGMKRSNGRILAASSFASPETQCRDGLHTQTELWIENHLVSWLDQFNPLEIDDSKKTKLIRWRQAVIETIDARRETKRRKLT